jgi:hypothetical protein
MQGGGAHARDSSIARGARPSGVRNPTQIGAISLRIPPSKTRGL